VQLNKEKIKGKTSKILEETKNTRDRNFRYRGI